MKTEKKESALDHLGYALYAFGGLGMEILLMMFETNLWGSENNAWTDQQHILHWIITCVIWGTLSYLLCKRLTSLNLDRKHMNWFHISIIIMISLLITTFTWNGVKVMIEFSTLGSAKFIVQYVYYAFESMLMVLIIAHGQEAFQQWRQKQSRLPMGGLLLALTWGLIHTLTQGAETGIYTCIQSILFGLVYMAVKQNVLYAYVAIAFMFMV